MTSPQQHPADEPPAVVPVAPADLPPAPRPRPALARVKALVPYLVVAGAVLAFHHRAAAPGAAFSTEDLRDYFIPLRALLQHTVAAGEWPFWQRSIYLGFPLWSFSEAALFQPTTWLYLGFDAARGVTLGSLTHLVAAALGVFTWMRYRGRGTGAAAAGACVVALGGYTTAHLDHWTFGATLMWLPWTLLAVDVALRQGLTPLRLLAAAAGMAALWFGGAAQLAYFSTLVVGGYVLLRVLGTRGKAWPVLLILPAGLLLATPLLLAGAELNAHGPRASGITLAWASEYRWMSWRHLVMLLFPEAWGPGSAYSGPWNFWEMTGYLGLATLVLVLTVRPRGMGWYFLFLLGLSLVMALGTNTPLFELFFKYLPGFSKFRVAARTLFIANFAAGVLVADAVDVLAASPRLRSRLPTLAGALVLLGVVWWVGREAPALGLRAESVREHVPFALGILGVLAAWVALQGVLPRAVFPAGIALLLFVDLRHHFADYMPVSNAGELTRAVLPAAPQLPPGERVAHLSFNANLIASWGAEGVNGYSQLLADRVFDLHYLMRDGRFSASHREPRTTEYGRQTIAPLSHLFPLFGASHLYAPGPISAPSRLSFVGREGPFWHYRLPALPLAFFSARHEVMDDAAFEARAASLDPFGTVTVAPTPEPLPPVDEAHPPRAVPIAERGANHTRLTVEAPVPGLVVLLDPWFPGWRAEVDGAPAALLRADYAFMAVAVPAGRHEVTLRYVPTTLLPGMACVLVVLGSTLGWALRRRRAT
ncbi:YfhO family protein [Myxococcaceae bacterium GXIMD 01537]